MHRLTPDQKIFLISLLDDAHYSKTEKARQALIHGHRTLAGNLADECEEIREIIRLIPAKEAI